MPNKKTITEDAVRVPTEADFEGYVAAVGINTPTDRYEPGDPVPAEVVFNHQWLIEKGGVTRGD